MASQENPCHFSGATRSQLSVMLDESVNVFMHFVYTSAGLQTANCGA